jgi:transcription-repair coupling factor (superfamily II helicase)
VRIDLWGDEVDRLTEFAVADQRSTHDLDCAEIFGCRELLATDEVKERAERLVGAEPWGREQWERLSQGLTFDGMESWLPWLTEGEHLLPDLIGDSAQVLLIDPRRMRDRAAELLDEEAALAGSLRRRGLSPPLPKALAPRWWRPPRGTRWWATGTASCSRSRSSSPTATRSSCAPRVPAPQPAWSAASATKA